MADETTTTTEAAPTNGAPKMTNGKDTDQTVPLFRLHEELSAKRQAIEARDSASKEIESLRMQLEKATNELNGIKTSHSQEMHLIELGFKAPSVRRFFRNEYKSAVSELSKDQRPSFDEWLAANQNDPLYSVHFERLEAAKPKPEAKPETDDFETPSSTNDDQQLITALRAALTGNPNTGADQPADNRSKEWTVEELRKLRARNRGHNQTSGGLGSARDEILEQWRKKGIIK